MASADGHNRSPPALPRKEWMMSSPANVFNLHNSALHVSYSNGTLGSKVALRYQDAHQMLQFDESNLRRVTTDLGEEVSVTIRLTVDAGSTTFTLVVPRVQLDLNQHANVDPLGVTAVHHFSIAPALSHGQQDIYQVAKLRGSAAAVPF
jgi:hypothetical protein